VAVLVVLVTGLGAGCGSAQQPSAAEQVPALSTRLDRVDSALAEHRFAAARRDLHALINATTSARRSGDLSAEKAQRILAAAAEVLDALPASGTPSPSASATSDSGSSPSPSSTSSPTKRPSRSPKPSTGPSSATTAPSAPATTPSATPTTPTTSGPSPATSTQQSTVQSAPSASPAVAPTG
jgi:hypothetical protein